MMAKRHRPLNAPIVYHPSDPRGWGSHDPLPTGRERVVRLHIWERMLAKTGKDGTYKYPWFTPEFKQAGDEIEKVFRRLSSGAFSKSQMGAMSGGVGGGESQTDDMILASARMEARYRAWANAMDEHRVVSMNRRPSEHRPVLPFLIDLTMDDLSIREAERIHHLRNGKGLELIEYGLGEYVRMAGWQRKRR